tara:strand:+ start:121 stop:357 length:237 start_codon:yes stop_codon:yes gene_type:complete
VKPIDLIFLQVPIISPQEYYFSPFHGPWPEIWEGIRKIGLIFGAKKFSGHDPDFGPRVSGEKWAADRARARRVHGGKL